MRSQYGFNSFSHVGLRVYRAVAQRAAVVFNGPLTNWEDLRSGSIAVPGNSYSLIPALHCVYQLAKLGLDL